MKEKIVSFEVAKLAKEKGFEADRNYRYFLDKNNNLITDEMVFNKFSIDGKLNEDIEVCKSILAISFIYTSTQSLLQKWLRENHNIHIVVDWFTNNTWSSFLVSDWDDNDEPEKFFETYEEALEDGLQEALKLI